MFLFYLDGDRRDLHSFPTRRSSDLPTGAAASVIAVGAAAGSWQAARKSTVKRLVRSFKGSVRVRGSILTGRFERSEEHTSELQSHVNLVCRLLLEKKKLTSSTSKTQ